MGVRIDERGIRVTGSLGGALDEALDLRLDGHRVWSFRPRRDGFRLGARSLLVPWPEALSAVLQGRAEVEVAAPGRAEPLYRAALLFGGSEEPVVISDGLGHRAAIDKVGGLRHALEDEPAAERRELLEAARRIATDLREHGDLDVFLCHGGLLGAVRGGRLAGHDVDLAFYSRYRHPFDVIRETRAAERALGRLGWQAVRVSGAGLRVWVPLPSGTRGSVEVVAAFHLGSTFHLGTVSGTLGRAQLLPLGETELEGVRFPAPADPGAVLELAYGPDWSTPDPAFRPQNPSDQARRSADWFRGSRTRLPSWQQAHRWQPTRSDPSEFAEWVEARLEPHSTVVEIGAGDGRDTIWLHQQGHTASGTDFCAAARTKANRAARDAGVPIDFTELNLESLHSVLTNAARVAAANTVTHLYGRRLIDVLAPSGRDGLWRFCAIVGRCGGRTFLEFRKDSEPSTLYAEIEQHGGRVVDTVVRRGLAPVGKEDPVITRLVLTWEKS